MDLDFDSLPDASKAASGRGGGLDFDALPNAARDPKIGRPEELTFAEKHVAPLLEKMRSSAMLRAGASAINPAFGAAMALDKSTDGNLRGSEVGGWMQGAADAGVGVVQLGANALGTAGNVVGIDNSLGEATNTAIADKEREYQAARAAAGREGVDVARLLGNVTTTALVPGSPLAAGGRTGALAAQGVKQGLVSATMTPITDGAEDYWTDKGKQAATYAATGAVVGPLLGTLARIVSPKASTNASLQLLEREGVEPTVGQTLGGFANNLEEKLTSIPVVGDRIAAMRRGAVEQFNNAAVNRAGAPIGVRVQGSGHDAVREVGDALSREYQAALGSISHVNFQTPSFSGKLSQLESMAQDLAPELAAKFTKTIDRVVGRKMSANGSIAGADLKAVDSELGNIAARYGRSAVASEQEFGDAVKQLQAIFKEEVAAANPAVAARLKAADKGWANLVRLEGAGKAAKNAEGVFTPAQLGGAVQAADNSVRKRAVGRGTALMQDLSNAGQAVLGNRVPDSGTPGRLMAAGSLLGGGAIHPAIPAALIAGAGLYTRPAQNVLRYLLTKRPVSAPGAANYLRRLAGPATGGAIGIERLLENQ